jgi:hypothetical protein
LKVFYKLEQTGEAIVDFTRNFKELSSESNVNVKKAK